MDLDLSLIKEGVGKTASPGATSIALQLSEGCFLIFELHPPAAIYFNADILLKRLDDAHRYQPVDGIIFIFDLLHGLCYGRDAHGYISLRVEKNEALAGKCSG